MELLALAMRADLVVVGTKIIFIDGNGKQGQIIYIHKHKEQGELIYIYIYIYESFHIQLYIGGHGTDRTLHRHLSIRVVCHQN